MHVGIAFGAMLLQEEHAIAYESRRLNEHEKNLGIYEKELLTILHAWHLFWIQIVKVSSNL